MQGLNAGTVFCTYPVDSLVDLESDGALGLGDGGTARGVHRETRQLSRQLKHMELGTEINTAKENEKYKIVWFLLNIFFKSIFKIIFQHVNE